MRIVDLFAGIGGLRSGAVLAIQEAGFHPEVVFTSEIKKAAIAVLEANYPNEKISGDITSIDERLVPDHDVLLAGFPCQAFSFAGSRRGFDDPTKGTLFFDVARILREKMPEYFILENVEGLIAHDPDLNDKSSGYGRTFRTILNTLTSLGYNVDWSILNATDFGVPQARKRVFIVGSKSHAPNLLEVVKTPSLPLSSVLEAGRKETEPKVVQFSNMLTAKYSLPYLSGKVIRDKRGGPNNLHSWNIGYKGTLRASEQQLMEEFLVQTRRSKWAMSKGIKKAECTPLNIGDIRSFATVPAGESLEQMLAGLTRCGYLVNESGEYRIFSGRLSMPLSHILDPSKYVQTLVATDADRIGVIDDGSIRRLTNVEIMRLFGFPDDMLLPMSLTRSKIFDVFGNSVVVPVAKAVVKCLISHK